MLCLQSAVFSDDAAKTSPADTADPDATAFDATILSAVSLRAVNRCFIDLWLGYRMTELPLSCSIMALALAPRGASVHHNAFVISDFYYLCRHGLCGATWSQAFAGVTFYPVLPQLSLLNFCSSDLG